MTFQIGDCICGTPGDLVSEHMIGIIVSLDEEVATIVWLNVHGASIARAIRTKIIERNVEEKYWLCLG